VRRSIVVLFAALVLIAGCNNQASQSNVPAKPKWQGAPYHLALGALPAKPSPTGVTLPAIEFTADPENLETRADLVVQVDVSGVKQASQVPDMMIMAPTDISGSDGALSADYINITNKELASMLSGYCMKGKVKISVALVRSTLPLSATDDQINDKRLSDWLPTELVFKNPHGKC
jgi:hypothetical protein